MKLSRLPLRPLLAAGAILAIGTGAFKPAHPACGPSA